VTPPSIYRHFVDKTHLMFEVCARQFALFDTAKDIQDGKFKGGTDTVFDLKSDAVGLGKVSAAGQPFEADVQKVADQIKSGGIANIPTEVGK